MNEDIFDDIIKEKLKDLPPKSNTDDVWSVFESSSARNKTNIDDQDANFDKIIKSNLQQVQPTYRAEHWQLLKSQLKTIEERKNTVFISKILEFAAIFLIVITYFNWSGWIDYKNKSVDPLLYATSTQSHDLNKVEKEPFIEVVKNKTQSLKATQATPSKAMKKSEFANFYSKINYSKVPSTGSEHFINPIIVLDQLHSDQQITLTSDPASIIINLQKAESNIIASISDELNQQSKPVTITSINNVNTDLLSSEFALSFPMKMSGPKSIAEYAVSVYGSGDINLINTPFDKLYSRASYNKEALNRSFGINVSKKVDQFELETGIGYARREYQPDLFREAFGQKENYYSEVSLDKIKFDIASLPINFKYHFINQSNWGAYIMAGAALNLVMNASYDVTEAKILGRPAPDRFIPEEPRLESKPFIEGLLAGENFRDNYFASVGFGFGIQKKLFNNTSIYVQPSYHRQILSADIGIGPNKDKIHTSSLQFGLKTVLN